MEIVDAQGLRAMPQASLAYLALGQAQAAAGKLDDALATLDRGLAHPARNLGARALGDDPPPARSWLASPSTRAACPTARELLGELDLRVSRFPDGMEAMRARIAGVVQLLLRRRSARGVLGEALTPRELDVLRLLQGSMSLQQIAGELYLSSTPSRPTPGRSTASWACTRVPRPSGWGATAPHLSDRIPAQLTDVLRSTRPADQ